MAIIDIEMSWNWSRTQLPQFPIVSTKKIELQIRMVKGNDLNRSLDKSNESMFIFVTGQGASFLEI